MVKLEFCRLQCYFSSAIHFYSSFYSVLVLDKPNLWNYCYSTVSIQLKILFFSFRKTRISKFFFSWFRLPAVSIPQREKMRSTYASDAGAYNKSNASGAKLWYIAWRSIQNCLPFVPPYDWSSVMYLSSCSWGDGPCVLPTWVLVILAARNVNFCSTGALTEEVLTVVESELSVADQVWFRLIIPNNTVVYLTFKLWTFSKLHFRSALNFRSSFYSVRLQFFFSFYSLLVLLNIFSYSSRSRERITDLFRSGFRSPSRK